MADLIKFGDKKFSNEDNAIFEEMMEPERSDDIDKTGGTGGETVEAGKDNLIHFPKKTWPPINWDVIEAIRQKEYPRIPEKVLAIIRDMLETPGDKPSFEFNDFGDEDYPPNPLPLRPVQGDAVWIIDLLDRYGGEVCYGKQRCVVRRTKKKPALFLVEAISRTTRDALTDQAGLGPLFEHYLESQSWTIWGKEVTPKLMALIVNNRQDEDRIYLGWFDRKTAWVIFRRMNDISIARVLGLE